MANTTTGDPGPGGLLPAPDDPRMRGLGVFVAVNLLATTLGAVQLREATFQPQRDKRGAILADTSRGTPRALLFGTPPVGTRGNKTLVNVTTPHRRDKLPDTSQGTPTVAKATFPAGFRAKQAPGSTPYRRDVLDDTSQGSPLGLLAGGPVALPAGDPQPIVLVSTPRNSTQPADTSQDTPLTLLTAAPARPFTPYPWAAVPIPEWQPLDTSFGTPKTLYSDVTFAPANLTESINALARPSIGLDTSRSSPLALLTGSAQSPFVPELFDFPKSSPWQAGFWTPQNCLPLTAQPFTTVQSSAPIVNRTQPADTSQDTPPVLLSTIAGEFVAPHQNPVSNVTQPVDTSQGMPTTLQAVPAPPFTPAFPLGAPSVLWRGADTSLSSPTVLLSFVQAPFTAPPPPPAPDKQRQQPDANLPSLLPLAAQPFTAPPPPPAPDKTRQQPETSHGANLPAQTFVQPPFEPVQHSAPVVNGSRPLDTSYGTPLTLLSAPVFKPFAQTDWPSPIEYRNTWQQQWTFYGQNPDGIPPALPVAPPAPDVTGGWPSSYGHYHALATKKRREEEKLRLLEEEAQEHERKIARTRSDHAREKERARLAQSVKRQEQQQALVDALTAELVLLIRQQDEDEAILVLLLNM